MCYYIMIIFALFFCYYFRTISKNKCPGGLIFGGAIAKGILRYEFGGLWRGLYMEGLLLRNSYNPARWFKQIKRTLSFDVTTPFNPIQQSTAKYNSHIFNGRNTTINDQRNGNG